MSRIYHDITETVGNTPLVELKKLATGLPGRVVVKVESFNPLGCVKERIGLSMINAAERDGTLKPGGTVIEPTSGNTGIGLAMVCAARGYHLILTMPDSLSVERRKLVQALGARLELTPGSQGMQGSIDRARELLEEIPGSIMPMQFSNPANPQAHIETTGPEIWRDTDGQVDIIVAGVGTGGTIMGLSTYLKPKKPSIQMIAVEPNASAVLSGGGPGPHKIQGIGAGFVPDIVDTGMLDEIVRVDGDVAIETSRRLAREEGILAGISSGAALAAALEVAARPESADKLIVVILPDTGERYLSTELFEA